VAFESFEIQVKESRHSPTKRLGLLPCSARRLAFGQEFLLNKRESYSEDNAPQKHSDNVLFNYSLVEFLLIDH